MTDLQRPLISKRVINQHYRSDGREKRSFETLKDVRAFNAELDQSVDSFDSTVNAVYRCEYCGYLHQGHRRQKFWEAKQRFMEDPVARMELGVRALAHLGGENQPDRKRRQQAVVRRGRKLRS